MRTKKRRVSYTISLSWTKAEAVRFARNYLRPFRSPDDHPPFTIQQFLEEVDSDFVFEEFIEEDPYRNPNLDSYFNYVAGRL